MTGFINSESSFRFAIKWTFFAGSKTDFTMNPKLDSINRKTPK